MSPSLNSNCASSIRENNNNSPSIVNNKISAAAVAALKADVLDISKLCDPNTEVDYTLDMNAQAVLDACK